MDPTLADIMAKLNAMHTDIQAGNAVLAELQAVGTGSWSWDKKSGILKMFNAEGTEFAVFSVSDSPDVAQRERRVDLES